MPAKYMQRGHPLPSMCTFVQQPLQPEPGQRYTYGRRPARHQHTADAKPRRTLARPQYLPCKWCEGAAQVHSSEGYRKGRDSDRSRRTKDSAVFALWQEWGEPRWRCVSQAKWNRETLKKNAVVNRITCRTNIKKGQNRNLPSTQSSIQIRQKAFYESFSRMVLSQPRLVGKEQTISIQYLPHYWVMKRSCIV